MSETYAPPESVAAWTFTLPAPMRFATFDLNGVEGIGGLLSITYLDGRVDTYVGIPQATATAFQIAADQVTFFNNQIARVYPQALLVEQSNLVRTISPPGIRTFPRASVPAP